MIHYHCSIPIALICLVASFAADASAQSQRIFPVESTDPSLITEKVVVIPTADLPVAEPIRITHTPGARITGLENAIVYQGGFYAHRRQTLLLDGEPTESLLELRAQNAVVFYGQSRQLDGDPNLLGVYLEGDVTLAADAHQIRTAQLYYDFQSNRALALDAVLRLHLPDSHSALYVRAAQVRQLGQNRFSIVDLKVSTDEFARPKIWAGAQRGRIDRSTDGWSIDMHHFTANAYDVPLFYWPRMKGTGTAQETPLRTLRTGVNSTDGVILESEWQLARLLNLPEIPGADTTLNIDGYSDRGPAVGIDADYIRRNFFGNLRTYLLHDDGEDRLSRFDSRREVPPTTDYRGRFTWQHRHYLPEDWQVTAEISYLSDPDYLEAWEPEEFHTEKEQETLLYFKKQFDNVAYDALWKWQINDFDATITELPGIGFHLIGQDLFSLFTYQQNTRLSRIQEALDSRQVPGFSDDYEQSILPPTVDQQDFTFGVSRHELTLPFSAGPVRIVPTTIANAVFDDSATGSTDDTFFYHSVLGARISLPLWHLKPDVKSRLFDLDGLRHIVAPELGGYFVDTDQPDAPEQDLLYLGLRQRFQTKRGHPDHQHVVDVLRWNTSLLLVEDDLDDQTLPQHFDSTHPDPYFAKPQWVNEDFANLGLTRREQFNRATADYLATDLEWTISDQTAVLTGANYNLHESQLSQADLALAVQRSPRLGYNLGLRYLRDGNVRENPGIPGDFTDNAFNPIDALFLSSGAGYQLNRKYTVAFSHQFDLKNSDSASTRLLLIRRFPHWFGAISVQFDPLRDDYAVGITIWPAAFEDIAIGTRRYRNIPGS